MCLLGHMLLNRGDNRRRILLRYLGYSHIPGLGGESPRKAMVVLYPRTKTTGERVVGIFRHLDFRLCAVGAIGFYLYWRFDVLVCTEKIMLRLALVGQLPLTVDQH